MALFLFILLVAVALGIIGVVVKGLFYLLIIGIVLFLINLVLSGIRFGHRRGSRPTR
ncbi:hypothetical protein [Actinomadura sp. BRA 177]|jgi:hypothetical protein|uniref:hypothetical protein n=1 Tax=Actinomadura sp. BRA 177 TaxID=2745202 RepID=UPI0015959546|nr:hypothetical protein [Actinomadura sp. BRA 177]NVI92204.1 hypothetical protein [Actinomadura sp. BRA 177]